MVGTATSRSTAPILQGDSGVAGVIADIRDAVASCRLCPAMAPYRKARADGLGTTATGYLLVGSAPDLEGRAFRDPAGDVLREALDAVGDAEFRTLEDLFLIAHAARCGPRHDQVQSRTRAPSIKECRNCRPFLAFELRALHPRLVVAVGAKATEAALGHKVAIESIHAVRQRNGTGEVLPLVTPSPYNRASLKRLDITIDVYRRWLTGLFGALIDDLRR